MCCRFALFKTPRAIAEALPQIAGAEILSQFKPRYNIAPTQPVLAVRAAQALGGRAEFTFLSWGLVPHWAKDASLAHSLFNARAESAAFKPSFKGPLRHHRCLIPADGFYEWSRTAPAGDGNKIGRDCVPWFFSPAQDGGFCFAALWEHWGSADGSEIESCALLTVAANADISPWHPRMPLTIAPHNYERWLDPAVQTPAAIADLLCPPAAGQWTARAVSPAVNSVRVNGPECLEPPPPPRQRELF